VVCGELQQTLRKPRDAEGYRAGAERALRGAERLRALAEDLLTLVRPTRDEEVVESELNRLIGGAVGPLEGLAAERGVRVLVGSASSALKVRGHARDLERMFRNLVENGVRHASGIVELSTRTAAGRFEVNIQDDGAGVADSDRDRIFEPFYRAPQARASALGGSGLGLAIAREIARAHDGDVTLAPKPTPTGGACFVVSLPAA
jgi:two-component system heavy metal sensor histidine kinase CusS